MFRLTKEISLGQLGVILIPAIAVIGGAWTTIEEVKELKRDSEDFASKVVVQQIITNMGEMRRDIRDIRRLVNRYVELSIGDKEYHKFMEADSLDRRNPTVR